MREECKHFQSRTYASGDTARFCSLDLAPEAPWRCPADCPRFERRYGDAGFHRGTLVSPAAPEEPPAGGGDIAALLDQAEEIINRAGPTIVAEVQAERERARRAAEAPPKWQIWKRFRR